MRTNSQRTGNVKPRTVAARSAVLAGATGLVGSQLLSMLAVAPEYARVFALTRRALPIAAPNLMAVPADFDALEESLRDAGLGADVYCCLGTTIGAAGSEAAFRRVDHDFVLALAHWAKARAARRFVLVSALGADPGSRVFYNRVKGEIERAVRAEGPASVTILQPSLLDGERAQSRPGEQLALRIARPLRALIPRTWRPVAARDVAAAMLLAARADPAPALIASAAMHGAAEVLAPATD
jgi:uncharacterized protein YbjT (DUF2867 family)